MIAATAAIGSEREQGYPRHGLAVVLAFTEVKMLVNGRIHVSAGTSLLVIGAVLLATIAAASLCLGNAAAKQRKH